MAGVCSKSGPASAANAGGFLQTSLSEVTRQSGFCAALQHPVRRVTPDRVPSVSEDLSSIARVKGVSQQSMVFRFASRIFATAGVALEWRDAEYGACWNSDETRTVVLDFDSHTAPSEHPGALAYALPYQGSHIVVLFDRFERSRG